MDRAIPPAAEQRQARIVELLQGRAFLAIQDLCAMLAISEATARRDLAELATRGLVRRTHGGAVPGRQVTQDFTNAERLMRNLEEKTRIARVAAGLVRPGDVVFLDAGTTTLKLAEALADQPDLTFVTNGLDICNLLTAARGTVFMIGGEYAASTHGFAGPLACAAIGQFTVDKLFLSVGAVDLGRGTICISRPELAETQRAMMRIAEQVIVLADHSKFQRSALSVIAPITALDHLVTDTRARDLTGPLPEEIAARIVHA